MIELGRRSTISEWRKYPATVRSLHQRSPRRLGPLLVYDGAKKRSGETWFYGILADPFEPTTELVVRVHANEEPLDPWSRREPTLEGVAEGWWFHAVPRQPGIHLLDLLAGDFTPGEREQLAFAILNAANLEEWRPPNWYPRLDDAFITFGGDVLLQAERRTPDTRMEQERWRAPLARQADAAVLAGCLVGENSFFACLAAAKALASGAAEDVAFRNARAALLVETIGVLLTAHTQRGPHLVPSIRAEAPSRDEVAAAIAHGAAKRFAEMQAWNDARARLKPPDLETIAPVDPARPMRLEKTFQLAGKYLIYGGTRVLGRSWYGTPVDGPFRDLVIVPSTTPNHDDIDFGGLVDPWGKPFEVDEFPSLLAAARGAAPLPLVAAASENRAKLALHVARAVTFAASLMEPSIECLSTTVDGRACADGLEPRARTLRWRGTPAEWRDAWAIVVVKIALGLGSKDDDARARTALGEIEEGIVVSVSDDARLNAALCRALLALTSTFSWARVTAEIAAACVGLDEHLPPATDAEVTARISYVKRERDRIVAELRARPVGDEANKPPRTERVTTTSPKASEVREDLHYAVAEARELIRAAWRRLKG